MLEKIIYSLLEEEPFYAHFLLGSRIMMVSVPFPPKELKEGERKPATIHDCPTAGARVTKSGVEFVFNTNFMSTLTLKEQKGILKHEILHVLFEHTGARGGLKNSQSDRQMKNYAMDCAINQHIEGLPTPHVGLKEIEEAVGKKLLPNEAWEYYFAALKQKQAELSKNIDHSFMESAEGDGQEVEGKGKEGKSKLEELRNKILIKDAAQKAAASAAGNVPRCVQEILQRLNKLSQVSWKTQFRNIIASTRDVTTRSSRQKVHRRFDLDAPGKKKIRKLVIGVCVDSSGSVSDEAFTAFMNEVIHVSKNATITYVVDADCEVHNIEIIKNGKTKKQLTRHGRGGTAYQPAITACLEKKCDVIVYFGDMDAADEPTNPRVPFIWVRVGSSEPPGKFGRVIDLRLE